MAVSVPQVWNGMYKGSMSEETAELVYNTRSQEVIPGLKKMIFNFPIELVERSLEEERSIREIVKEEDIDWHSYIGEMRNYQTVGTAFMYYSPRSIIGDGVGLGKTVEISALINFLKTKNQMRRFLIAVETSALGQTQCELMKFTGLYVVQLPSEAYKLKKAISEIKWSKVDGIVIKHSTLRSDVFSKWIAQNLNSDGGCNIFDTFFLDESSVIKNVETKIATYTKNICNVCKRVHFMNATVFETNIMDIYNQMDMLVPDLLPKKSKINKQYCTFGRRSFWVKEGGKAVMKWAWDMTGYKNQEEFKKRIQLYYFARCKADIGMDRPHIYKVYEIEPNNNQSLALAKKYRYMEVLNCPSLIPELKMETIRANVPKLDRLCQLLEEDFSDDQVMVYCFHIEAQKAIRDELLKIGRKPAILNGDSSDEERYECQKRFNSGEYDVIITNIQKSLNLHGGTVCIFYTVLTNSARLEQVRGRIDRNTTDDTKTFVLLLYKGTDEHKFFMDVVKERAKNARDLTIDAKTAVDYFIDALNAG